MKSSCTRDVAEGDREEGRWVRSREGERTQKASVRRGEGSARRRVQTAKSAVAMASLCCANGGIGCRDPVAVDELHGRLVQCPDGTCILRNRCRLPRDEIATSLRSLASPRQSIHVHNHAHLANPSLWHARAVAAFDTPAAGARVSLCSASLPPQPSMTFAALGCDCVAVGVQPTAYEQKEGYAFAAEVEPLPAFFRDYEMYFVQ